MEEAEAALEQEENKVVRAQMDLAQTKQEIERRLQEKEEEFENTRKNFARALDSMQASLDGEIKAKEEALRIKKKIEGNIMRRILVEININLMKKVCLLEIKDVHNR